MSLWDNATLGDNARFLLTWVSLTGAAVVGTMLMVRKTEIRRVSILTWRRIGPGAITGLVFLSLFLAVHITLILYWDDFAYYDHEYFTRFTLKGHNIPLQSSSTSGRFFPLSFQEFNLIRHFTSTNTGYHIGPIIQLLMLSCIVLVIDEEISITAR
jgi:hypothetical protein